MSNLHKTYGVYPDGSWKRNAVECVDLAIHIEYNTTFRFGRALIVDGVVVYKGFVMQEKLDHFIKVTLPDIDSCWHPTSNTAPYQ
jgi:hypothetical protein